MTDPQLTNNNNSNNNDNNNNSRNNNSNNNNINDNFNNNYYNAIKNYNNDVEPKYLHKKFKKVATSEVVVPMEIAKENPPVFEQTTSSSKSVIRQQDTLSKDSKQSSKSDDITSGLDCESSEPRKSRYICPYCKQVCTKPSVLKKHIRSHTNERPYPCTPCNASFKTRSNLYKHCRSRAHALKTASGEVGKVSEDSDVSLSDSASNGTRPLSQPSELPDLEVLQKKTIKTGKIYKPKFHTAMQSINNEVETSVPLNHTANSLSVITNNKPNAEQVQEHIDKIITDNQAIVDAVDPRLQKLMQRQQGFFDMQKVNEQPVDLSPSDESMSKKRSYNQYSVQNQSSVIQESEKSSIIMDLLLNSQSINSTEKVDETYINGFKNVSHSSVDNFDVQRVSGNEAFSRSSSLSSVPSPPLKYDSQLELEINKKDDSGSQKLSEYHLTIQPLPSPGPLLGNTRLVDAYGPSCAKKLRSDSILTLPRQNSVQMFGGEVRILDNSGETKTMRIEPRQTNSPLNVQNSNSQCATIETSSIVVRSGLHSGGTIVHKPSSTSASALLTISNTPAISTPIIPNISTPNIAPTMTCYNYLQPINPLTNINAYNPLTLPQPGLATIFHGGKIIPYVPGMPGPHSFTSTAHISPIQHNRISMCKVIPGIPGLHMGSQPLELKSPVFVQTLSELDILEKPTSTLPSNLGNPSSPVNKESIVGSKTPNSGFSNPETLVKPEDKFPSRSSSKPISQSSNVIVNRLTTNQTKLTTERESNIDRGLKNTIDELDFCTSVNSSVKKSFQRSIESKKRTNQYGEICLPSSDSIIKICALNSRKNDEFLHTDVISKSESVSMDNLVIYNEINIHNRNSRENPINDNRENNSNFLRPTSLPLKPGTFVPKRHHGITPTANTESLITPDTPRPIKSYGQLYLNGHAYTYLGLKCSTKVFYCTLNRPQPMYVPQQHGLSMYSNWKICREVSLDLELSHYDSRHRPSNYAIAHKAAENILTHSSYHPFTPSSPDSGLESDPQEKLHKTTNFNTGFESNEDYIYVRGRGRGKYICKECGIRCKKPSMLNKHSRTHTDVRPYTCKYCNFSFKTKGNLTKHMKSKSHYKKCIELGTTPVPTSVCDENIDKDAIAKLVAVGGNTEESSEEDDESDNEESEDSGTEEQEAAQSLLRLSQPNTNRLPGLLSSCRPSTYPYACANSTIVTTSKMPTITSPSVSTTSSKSTVIQSFSHRYYFPSNKLISKETRDSVIRSSKLDDPDLETKELDKILKQQQQQHSQPIDLTLKIPDVIPTPVILRSNGLNITPVTPVSKPVLIHAVTRTQHHEWKPRTDGHMLQAYLTEKHMMDNKTKQQYFVAPSRCDEHSVIYSDNNFTKSKNYFSGSISSTTCTDPIQTQKSSFQEKEYKETCKKNTFEMKTLQSEQNFIKNESRLKKKKIYNRQEVSDTENKTKSVLNQSPIIYEKQRDCKLCHDSSVNNLEFNDENRDQLTKDITNIDDKLSNRKIRLLGHKSHDQLQPLDIHSEEFRNTSEDSKSSEKPEFKHPVQLSNGLKHPVARKMVVASTPLGGSSKSQSKFLQPSSRPATSFPSCSKNEDGKCICNVCNKEFSKMSQLNLHMNIHYFERPYKCNNCSVSFRVKGHLAKHERSSSHMNKVNMTSTFGTATSSNPRPFQCTDCKIAFRIHGHLAKHLRSKMHIQRLECLCKLPFGIYTDMERSGINMNEIDTTDCIQSTASLQMMAKKLYEHDPSKMNGWDPDVMPQGTSGGDTSSDESESILSHQYQKLADSETAHPAHAYHDAVTLTYKNESKDIEGTKSNSNVDSALSFKCQICLRLFKTSDECQAHFLLEHSGEGCTEKGAELINYGDGHDENMQKRIFYARQT